MNGGLGGPYEYVVARMVLAEREVGCEGSCGRMGDITAK